MSPEMMRIIRNVPVEERHGNYVVSAKFGSGVPVLSVSRNDDRGKVVNLAISLAFSSITLTPGMALDKNSELWSTVSELFNDLATCEFPVHQLQFEDNETLMAALECFLNRLEKA